MTMQEELKKLADRQDKHEAMFHRHLEIYANNGKELKELTGVIYKIVPMFEENTKQTKEMYEVFNAIATTKKVSFKFFAWLTAVLLGFGSLILMWKQIIK